MGGRTELIKCGNPRCPNTFEENGRGRKKKFCCTNCAKIVGYHRNKVLTRKSGQVQKQQARFTICSECKGRMNTVSMAVSMHSDMTRLVIRVGRACKKCKILIPDEEWRVPMAMQIPTSQSRGSISA